MAGWHAEVRERWMQVADALLRAARAVEQTRVQRQRARLSMLRTRTLRAAMRAARARLLSNVASHR